MFLKKTMIGTAAVLSILVVAGCGSAADISGSQGASLTKQNFASAMASATSQSRSVHMTATFGAEGRNVTLSADESLNGSSLKDQVVALQVNIAAMGDVEVRIVSGVMYVNVGKLGLPGASAKPWIKVDLSDAKNPLGAAFSKIAAMNPAQLMKAFQAISTFTELGTETVDGVRSTHYKVTVDTAKVGAMLGMPDHGQTVSLPKTVAYDVWVDAGSRPVKVTVNNAMFTAEVHFSRWGEPVHVVAPPASQVGEFSF